MTCDDFATWFQWLELQIKIVSVLCSENDKLSPDHAIYDEEKLIQPYISEHKLW